jgi:eukaryotic-like serine/threonine-protein kinase
VDTTATDPMAGALLEGRYRVGARIARGGMATVYEATDTRLDRVVAVKVLHSGYAEDEHFVARFIREARSAARLAHPNVVGVFDQGEDDGTLYLAMEYVSGCTLRDLLQDEGPLSPARALSLLEPVLSALAAAHDAGFVHRDVKPENVLITDDGRVKVADFGLVRAVSTVTSGTTTSGVLIGTVSYLAPELVTEGSADARSDVYSAGIVLYEMLTGRKPHQGETPIQVAYKHVHEDVPPPSAVAEDVPAYLDALVARATARRRDARPADAKVFLNQLRRVRHALDHGVVDDAELTQDLTPATRSPDGREPTLAVLPAEVEPDATGDPTGVAAGPDAGGDDEDPDGAVAAAAGRSRRRMLLWAAVVLVLLLATVGGIAGWYYNVGRYTDTPDLSGMTLAQARGQLSSTDLHLRADGRVYSETVPAGDIVSTDPPAGEEILREGTITAVVSKGKERYPVPDVVGEPAQRARRLLRADLAVGDVTRKFSDQAQQGVVISASHQQGDRVRPDTAVDLVVSKGPLPIEVPDVVGDDREQAVDEIEDVGLEPTVSTAYDDSVPKGEVISQSPADGILHRGDEVSLVVSLGPPLVDVPSVYRDFRDTAIARLEQAGFEVDVEQAEGYVGFDIVGAQSPEPSEEAPRGSTVTIYLY